MVNDGAADDADVFTEPVSCVENGLLGCLQSLASAEFRCCPRERSIDDVSIAIRDDNFSNGSATCC